MSNLGSKLGLLVASVLLSLLLAEGLVRLRAHLRYGTGQPGQSMLTYDEQLDLRVPSAGYELSGQRLEIRINSLGFRGDEMERVKRPGVIRIACVGASTTFGSQVSTNAASWPSQLQSILSQEYPDVTIEVVNAGVPGFTLTDSLRNLRHRVLPLEPDLVVVYHANNDIAHDTRALAKRRGLVDLTSPGLLEKLGRYSLMVDLARKNLEIFRGADNSQQTDRLTKIPENLPQRFVSVMDELNRELENNGVRLVLSTFLVKYRREQSRTEQLKNADVAFYYMPWMSIEALLDAMDLYNRAIVNLAHARGIPVVTERESIPADERHYVDCMHMTDAGSRRLAERFAQFLIDHRILEEMIEGQSDDEIDGQSEARASL